MGLLLVGAAVAAVAIGHDGAGAGERAKERRPPVVIVVFDEFPADTLIGPDGRIDAARYPNFAALARTSASSHPSPTACTRWGRSSSAA